MKLKYIKTDRCPICGCDIVVCERIETDVNSINIREHVYGGQWEYRQFACGYEIHYCPNFRREEITKECTLDPNKIEREKKKSKAKDILYDIIESLDIDNDCKNRFKNAIKYI